MAVINVFKVPVPETIKRGDGSKIFNDKRPVVAAHLA
jgi:hypothetical protein